MDSNEDQQTLGYLKGLIESQTQTMKELKEEMRKDREATQKALKEIRDELSLYKTIVNVAKAIGWTGILILTLKFGDIKLLWNRLL